MGLHAITVPEEDGGKRERERKWGDDRCSRRFSLSWWCSSRRPRARVQRPLHRRGGDQPRQRVGGPVVRRALQLVHQPDCKARDGGAKGDLASIRESPLHRRCRKANMRCDAMRCVVHSLFFSPLPLSLSQARFLPGLMSGEQIGALAMSEVGAGSDVMGMKTRATRDDSTGDYVLNGNKMWITNGPCADVVVVYARTDDTHDDSDADRRPSKRRLLSAFIVPRSSPGFSASPKFDKLGMRGSDTSELVFDNVVVPADCVLGGHGNGTKVLMSGLNLERLVREQVDAGERGGEKGVTTRNRVPMTVSSSSIAGSCRRARGHHASCAGYRRAVRLRALAIRTAHRHVSDDGGERGSRGWMDRSIDRYAFSESREGSLDSCALPFFSLSPPGQARRHVHVHDRESQLGHGHRSPRRPHDQGGGRQSGTGARLRSCDTVHGGECDAGRAAGDPGRKRARVVG